jgi:hypothetical protein
MVLSVFVRAHESNHPGEAMARAAQTWLGSLDEGQRRAATYAVNDDERENWHFVPRSRQGLALARMSPAQRTLARDLVATGLSERGLLATDAIIVLEDVLFAMQGSSIRDRTLYHFTVFGEPGKPAPWGWRIEGHHLSINFLVAGDRIAATPMFFGANPAEVRIEHAQKGRRALAAEEDEGRALMLSLATGQQRTALIATRAPEEIITGNDRVARLSAPSGLAYSAMTPDQQARLRGLVAVYANRLRSEIADTELQRIADQGWNQVHFAWAGGTARGDAHYYRIHSPHFVIEYDNIQNDGNHIHTTWRRFEGDFGRDLLREHVLQDHRPAR